MDFGKSDSESSEVQTKDKIGPKNHQFWKHAWVDGYIDSRQLGINCRSICENEWILECTFIIELEIMLTQVVGRQIRVMLQSYLDMTCTGNDRIWHSNRSLYGIRVDEMCAIVENICTTGFNIIENALKWSISVQKEMFLRQIMDLYEFQLL